MSFEIDKQTLDELNLTGKFRTGSIYGIFNHMKTRAGEFLLDKLFSRGLTDAKEINDRTAIFQYFCERDLSFPLDAGQVNLTREYLDSGTGMNIITTAAGAVIKRLLSALTRDDRYKKNIQGLHAVIGIIHRCHLFVNTLTDLPPAYAEKIKSIRTILTDKRIELLRDINIYRPLPVRSVILYNHLLRSRMVEEMEALLLFVAELDVNIGVAAIAKEKNYSFANALPPGDNLLELKDLRHPSVDRAVGNPLSLSGRENILFLTGANMAGKSTFMKSVGIAIYLAHIGFPVAAESMQFSVREGLYSSINVADSISLGYSHFYAEVVRVKQAAVAASSGKRLFLMFDELFKGTNVKDAFDGTSAVIEGFSDYRECLFIISTHIIEVGEKLHDHENIKFRYMPTVMDGSRPRYTYKMQNGITEDRQGMLIIRNERILEMIGE